MASSEFPSTLAQLQRYTEIVADTPEFDRIAPYSATSVTTNPTNIFVASKQSRFTWIVDEALAYARAQHEAESTVTQGNENQIAAAYRRLLVGFGAHVASHITGFVSSQVDPQLAFDTDRTVKEACAIVDLYESLGVPKGRVMIKVAATWEGLRAARILEQPDGHNIRCTMTLVQSVVQATAAGEVGATRVSPFVGRVLDWWHKNRPGKDYSGPKDPGVKLCWEIDALYRKNGYKTKLMAAIRSVDQCVHLAGIDAMTLPPALLEELKQSHYKVDCVVGPKRTPNDGSRNGSIPQETMYCDDEVKFRSSFFADRVAYEKVGEGLRIFQDDAVALKGYLRNKLYEAVI